MVLEGCRSVIPMTDPVGRISYPELAQHPRREKNSCGYRCSRGKIEDGEFATIIDREVFRFTPGCFKDGGEDAIRRAIVIYCECRQRAKNIVGMFEHGVLNEDDPIVIIGADPGNICQLDLLEEHITNTHHVSYDLIRKLTHSSGVFPLPS